MPQPLLAILMLLLTIGSFFLMIKVYMQFSYPFLIPVLTSTILIVSILLIFDISYDNYMVGAKWIDSLLGPAVISLAYPLYKQRKMLMTYVVPIIISVLVGLFTAILSGFLFAKLFHLSRIWIISMIPKSLTTPVAIQISTAIGGVPPMTVVFVMVAGFTGVLLGPTLFKWARIESSLGRGIAFGSASHALGTSKAFEFGEQTASMSSVSMTLSAIFGSVIGPFFVWAFQI